MHILFNHKNMCAVMLFFVVVFPLDKLDEIIRGRSMIWDGEVGEFNLVLKSVTGDPTNNDF